MTAPRFARCKCGHAKERHEIPGFDGECSHDCKCPAYRPDAPAAPPVASPIPPARQPAPVAHLPEPARPRGGDRPPTSPAPAAALPDSSFERLIAAGKRSPRKGTVAIAERVERQAVELRERLIAERQAAEDKRRREAEAQAARAEVERLRLELAAARGSLPRGGARSVPGGVDCPECGRNFAGPQAAGSHRARSHGYRKAV